jgi:hypothetical protein
MDYARLRLAARGSCRLRPRSGRPSLGIYEPRFRTAEQLAPLVAPLLGPDGAALPDPQGGKLILQGEPAAIAQALEALRSLDGALHQYRIESETRSRESLDRAFAGAGGWVDGGELRIGRVAAGAGGSERTRRLGASVVVLEGQEASIWTGVTVPVNRSTRPARPRRCACGRARRWRSRGSTTRARAAARACRRACTRAPRRATRRSWSA